MPKPLVSGPHRVAQIQLTRPPLGPGLAAVYVTAQGVSHSFGRILTRGEALTGEYKNMYEVDTSHRQLTVRDNLPTRGDNFGFRTDMSIGWRVVDAALVVSQTEFNADEVVKRAALEKVRAMSRRYELQDCARLEDEINRMLRSGSLPIARYGLEINHLSAEITVDAPTARHSHEMRALDFGSERQDAVAHAVQGEFGLITRYLSEHPGEELQVMSMMHARQVELEQRQDARYRTSQEIFQQMLANNLIQDVDVEDVRKMIIANTLSSVSGQPAAGPSARPDSMAIPARVIQHPQVASAPAGNAVPAQIIDEDPAPARSQNPAPNQPPNQAQPASGTGVDGWRVRSRSTGTST